MCIRDRTLSIHDLKGREVAILVNKQQARGQYLVDFEAQDLPAGIYLAKLQEGNVLQTIKLVK